MSEKILKEVVSELNSIYTNIPSTYELEEKLDKIIDLMERQFDVTKRIANSLDNIYENMPMDSGVSTNQIERSLESIWNKLEDINESLSN